MNMLRRVWIVATLIAAGCAAPAASSVPVPSTPGPSSASASTAATPTVTEAQATSIAPSSPPEKPISIAAGVVTIDADGIVPLVFVPPEAGSTDPFFHIHTSPATDGFFLGIELYTVYGAAWTGQTGTFPIDCTPAGTGICVHFDPDGPGPQRNLGADFLATGQIRIDQLTTNEFDVTLTTVAFSDGTTIPGPLRLIAGGGA
jgi:hypothetical protein